MASATPSPLAASPRSPSAQYFLLRRLHSLTGILFGLYLLGHLAVNATLIEGTRPGDSRSVYQIQVDKIHELPLLNLIEWLFIYLPLAYHAIYGFYFTLSGQINIYTYPYFRNWIYYLQRISAFIIAPFVLFHILAMKGLLGASLAFDPHHAVHSVVHHMTIHPLVLWLVYPLGIIASTHHLANGFWTAGISWGLTVSARAQRRWRIVCAAILILSLGCGIAAWATVIGLSSEMR